MRSDAVTPKSDGTRSDVISKVYATKVNNGLIGSFSFNKNGDLSGAKGAAVLFTIHRDEPPEDDPDHGARSEVGRRPTSRY